MQDKETNVVEQLLEQAKSATKQGHWSLVNQYLQQLLLAENNRKSLSLATSQVEQALDLALSVLECGDFQQRWNVAKLLPKLEHLAIEPLIEILEDEEADLDQRWFVCRILGEFNRPEVIVSLVNLLQSSEDEDLAAIAASALANLGKSSLDGLTKLLSQPENRLLAASALAQIPSPEIIEPLLTVVKDSDSRVRATAVEALGSFHDERIPPVLIAALQDTVAMVRKEAVTALGFHVDLASQGNLLDHFQPLLYDLNLEVCQQAAIAISRLKSEDAATVLFKVLQSSHTPIPLQITLIRVLGWMEIAASLSHLQAALTIVPEESILEIIKVLGRIETANLKRLASHILLEFFYSRGPMVEKPLVKQTLAYAWGQLGIIDAKDALSQLEEDEHISVRLHAIASIKRLST